MSGNLHPSRLVIRREHFKVGEEASHLMLLELGLDVLWINEVSSWGHENWHQRDSPPGPCVPLIPHTCDKVYGYHVVAAALPRDDKVCMTTARADKLIKGRFHEFGVLLYHSCSTAVQKKGPERAPLKSSASLRCLHLTCQILSSMRHALP